MKIHHYGLMALVIFAIGTPKAVLTRYITAP